MDYLEIKERIAKQLATMFLASPGYQEYVRDRVRTMKMDPTGLWDDMPELVASKIAEQRNEKEKNPSPSSA